MLLFSTCALLALLALAAAQDYYKILNVDKSADERDLKKAYRRLSKKYHPDKNPDDESAAQKFVEVSEAYEILADAELRQMYDRHGAEAVKQHKERGGRGGGGGGGRSPFDIFNQFFGGGGHFGQGRRQGPDMEVRIHVSLKDFYMGAEHEFKVEKQVICSKCEGTGSEDGIRDTCPKCSGHGMLIQKQMLAPGIFQQIQTQCDACAGKGETVRHECKTCKGQRVVRSEESFDLTVEKGMPRGTRVYYENEGDESPDWEAGSLIVQIVDGEPKLAPEEKDRTDGTFFRRRGDNLFWREVLSLREAWMGDWTRNLTHLDGHVVQLSRKRGEVVQPGHVEVVPGEGMPIWQDENGGYGALHVEYVVVLPDQMESGMEKEFWSTWEKWRKKIGVDLQQDSGRPAAAVKHDEL